MFLIQYFCLHSILLFFKSYPEIGSTWSTTKCRRRNSFDTWQYIVICATFCVSIPSKSKPTNIFSKHSEIRSTWSINSSKEEIFCHVIVKNYLCKVLCKSFLPKLSARGGAKSKNRRPSWHYFTMVGLSVAATGGAL